MRWFGSAARSLLALSCLLNHHVLTAKAIDLDPTNKEQVKQVAKKVAAQLVSQYAYNVDAGSVPSNMVSGQVGILPYGTKDKYFWWLAGGMFGTLIDYWYYTGDTTYNQLVIDGIQAQIGDTNFLPVAWSFDIGNDDQLFWAFTVMSAAELGFPNPPDDKPGWLELAQSVMNQLIWHLDNDQPACNGGLRWQNKQLKAGWHYKNTAANGGMAQLGFRLAKYTGNKTYADYANKVYDWMVQSPIIADDYTVNDGTDPQKNCVDADQTQWTYNYGIMLAVSSYAYVYHNKSDVWKTRLQGYLNRTDRWFPPDTGTVMYERCERIERGSKACNGDQYSFKAYFTRWLTVSAQLVPDMAEQIMPRIRLSAKAAARVCDDATSACGTRWYMDKYDGLNNVGSQMSALAVIAANLYREAPKQVTAIDGGTSKGNPAAGTGDPPPVIQFSNITNADKAGAWIVTLMVLALLFGGAYWMVTGA